jgi:hypothetical protein
MRDQKHADMKPILPLGGESFGRIAMSVLLLINTARKSREKHYNSGVCKFII